MRYQVLEQKTIKVWVKIRKYRIKNGKASDVIGTHFIGLDKKLQQQQQQK
jgi:hypothetical protein